MKRNKGGERALRRQFAELRAQQAREAARRLERALDQARRAVARLERRKGA